MKKLSKTIASVGLSLLAVGAMAQSPDFARTPARTPGKNALVYPKANQGHKVSTGGTIQGYLDYVDGDASINNYTYYNGTSGNYTRWTPYLNMNSRYTIADTLTDPITAGGNYLTVNSTTVVYDTLWDYYAFVNKGNGYVKVKKGSVSIDTIGVYLDYSNKSNTNDTLIFTVNGVNAGGFRNPAVVYAADTEIIVPHSAVLPGTSLDSIFYVNFPVSINIPASAVGGWHFSIHTTVNGSKNDTLGLDYWSAFTSCSGGWADSITALGPVDGVTPHVNSFVTGLYWYNSKDVGGSSDAQETFPLDTGAHAGLWYNTSGKTFFDRQTCAQTPPFIAYPYEQNIGIFLSVDYDTASSLGVNNIAYSGLSVAQNSPNPFNKETTISYSLTKSTDVTFTVFDITGRVITTTSYGVVAPGQYQVNLSANSFSPGVYFYTFNVGGSLVTKKMVITN